jgi:hypothetical protein
VRIRGPRRSAVNELDEASKKVYSPEAGEAREMVAGASTMGGCSSASVTLAGADIKIVGSIFIILDG